MSTTPILQVNFKLNIPIAAYEHKTASLAAVFADVPGLVWKIWILNREKSEAGGIYLFESEQALADFLDSPLTTAVRNNPAFSLLTVKRFDVMPDVTAITNGPVPVLMTADTLA
jgi:hypothetical protein